MSKSIVRDLVALLAERMPATPSRIVGFSGSESSLALEIEGYPWWRDPPLLPEASERLSLQFRGIERMDLDECSLGDPYNRDEDLDGLKACQFDDTPYSPRTRKSLFCTAPARDPLRLILTAEIVLRDLDCPFPLWEFLNGEGVADFVTHCAGSVYLLGSVFPALEAALCTELRRQGVDWSLVPSQPAPQRDPVLVRLGTSWIVCAEAFAQWSS